MGGGAAAGRPAGRGTQARPNVRLIVPCGAFTLADSVAGMRRPAALIIALLISLAIAPAARATTWKDFDTPHAPQWVAADSGGTIWYTTSAGHLGKVVPTPNGATVTEFDNANIGLADGIVAAAGKVFFTDETNDKVWSFDPASNQFGSRSLTVTTGTTPTGIAYDGTSLWVTMATGDKVTPFSTSLT